MMSTSRFGVAVLILILQLTASAVAQEYYYDLDVTYSVTPSSEKIALQYDSAYPEPQLGQFFSAHSCLDDQDSVTYLHRGFFIFGLTGNCGYSAAATDLLLDSVVSRVVPVYVVDLDGAEFKVTDLIDVQFHEELSVDSCNTILDSFGLHFVDSSEFRHNLWECALDDTISESPLGFGNALHILDETEWACAHQYAAPELQFDPPDPYFVYQWNLKNTGQNGGIPDNDIDADSAWLVPIYDSSYYVAIIDDGFTTHIDFPDERLSPGYDFTYPPDFDPSPYVDQNHGMACMGLLAATLGDTGVVGVAGSSWITPVRIFNDQGRSVDTLTLADAIRYAATKARVISNSWGYPFTAPIAHVANAIRDVSNECLFSKDIESYRPAGSVLIFAAGNYAENPHYPPFSYHIDSVVFPANMPEVIAVGSIDNEASKWDYSCFGSALDVMAPSGFDGDSYGDMSMASNLWTIDQMGDLGWNPNVTGGYAAETDDVDYTAMMGGTSGACPQVAGIVALLMARGHPDILACNPGADILNIIANSAEDLGDSLLYGYGRANAYRALLSVIRGDLNNDGWIDALDVGVLVDILFANGHAVLDDRTADVDCDGLPTPHDLNFLIDHVYNNGPAPEICFEYAMW